MMDGSPRTPTPTASTTNPPSVASPTIGSVEPLLLFELNLMQHNTSYDKNGSPYSCVEAATPDSSARGSLPMTSAHAAASMTPTARQNLDAALKDAMHRAPGKQTTGQASASASAAAAAKPPGSTGGTAALQRLKAFCVDAAKNRAGATKPKPEPKGNAETKPAAKGKAKAKAEVKPKTKAKARGSKHDQSGSEPASESHAESEISGEAEEEGIEFPATDSQETRVLGEEPKPAPKKVKKKPAAAKKATQGLQEFIESGM